MIFPRLIWSALAAALLVGTVQSGIQQWQAVPIVLAAEMYEGQRLEAPSAPAAAQVHVHAEGVAPEPAHAHGTAQEWMPAEGTERMFWTWTANVLHAFSMALLVFAVMGVCLWRGTAQRSLPLALLVASAGWLSFHFWPSLGLPAEIPGMDAARMGSRQGWWVLAAVSAGLACALPAVWRSPLRWAAAAAWLALPFVVGAPLITADPLAGFSGDAQAQLRELGTQFVWATTWVSVSFWLAMGLVCGPAFQRWLRPVLQATFESSQPNAPVSKAVNP